MEDQDAENINQHGGLNSQRKVRGNRTDGDIKPTSGFGEDGGQGRVRIYRKPARSRVTGRGALA